MKDLKKREITSPCKEQLFEEEHNNLSKKHSGRRIMITGGSGFIGTNLVDYYSELNECLNVDIVEPRNPKHKSLWRNVDINDLVSLERIINEFKPNIVIHLAARTDLCGATDSDYRTNIVGVRNLVSCLDKQDSIEIAVFASTKLVCKNGYVPKSDTDYCPDTTYGRSKAIGEKVVRESAAFPFVIVRPTSIWGPWFGPPYKDFFLRIKNNRYWHLNVLNLRKSYGYVGNIVFQIDTLCKAAREVVAGETFYVSDYEPIELGEWADLIQSTFGTRRIKRIPLSLLKTAALVGDIFHRVGIERFPMSSFRLKNMLTCAIYDLKKTEEVCGALPFSVKDGVECTVKWIENNNVWASTIVK